MGVGAGRVYLVCNLLTTGNHLVEEPIGQAQRFSMSYLRSWYLEPHVSDGGSPAGNLAEGACRSQLGRTREKQEAGWPD